jgi:hypothetical protein
MGSIRDELYDTMWDEWTCKEHGTTMSCRRFGCSLCESEAEAKKDTDVAKARKLLKANGLGHLSIL